MSDSTQKARRAAVAKAFRSHKVALRKGHWRITTDEVTWLIDLRADSPRPDAALTFEVGAWVPGAGPEPEGGATDCPLLVDVVLGEDPIGETVALVEKLSGIATLAELAGADLSSAAVDAPLRRLLGW